jgi:hypothetical protein
LHVVGVCDFLNFSNKINSEERSILLGYQDIHSFERDGHSFIKSLTLKSA